MCCCMLAALFVFSEKSEAAKTINRIAAVVNDEVITEMEVERAISRKNRESKPGQQKPDRQKAINELVDNMLFDQIISKASIAVSEEDMARAIAGVLHENRITLDKLRAELAQKGMSYEEYKKDIEKEIKRIKYINQVIGPKVKISDQDLRDFYQRNQEMFRGRHSAHLGQIVIPLEGLATETQFLEIRDMALSIVAKARQGKSFTELAIKHSKGPNAEQGGDLGMIDLKNLPQAVAQAVHGMRVGGISNPIFANNSLIIIKVISLPEISAEDFEKLRDDIYAALYESKIEETFNNYMLQERQKAYIDVR